MEQYNQNEEVNSEIIGSNKKTAYELYDGFKSFISTFLGVIVAIIGIGVVFVVSSLEGTKEIKASNKENAYLIGAWRENNVGNFPENRVDIIRYNDKDYYFVVEEFGDNKEVIKWYFAYEGGLGYVFSDYKFYILTGITIMVSVFVAQINYTTAINSTMGTTKFLKTLKVYQDSKNKVAEKTQYIPMFCSYKNKQLYENTKRDIVEGANISYDYYVSERFDPLKLEKWQQEALLEIEKIRIERITPSDLLQEKTSKSKRQSHLPISPEKHKVNYLMTSFIQKIISSALSGMVVALGVVLGNWVLGLTYGFTVLLSFITSNITGADYANSGLRQRYIAKADLLNEFYNMVGYFEEEAKKEKQKQENIALEKQKQEKLVLEKEKQENLVLEKEKQETIILGEKSEKSFLPITVANSKEI